MARTYRRDSRGRFAGGGGGSGGGGGRKSGGGSKPKTTSARGRAKSKETAARQAVKAGGGSKATRSLLTAQRARDFYKATGTGTKRSASRVSGGSRSAKAAMKPAKMSKAPASKAKQAYQAARSQVRELKMYRGGRTDATVKKAAAKVARMERNRGVSKPRRRKA